MRKTLLLAAAIACSGVVQAEQFVCTAHVFTVMTIDTDTAEWVANRGIPTASNPIQVRVDTEKGMYSPDTERYEGVCEVSSNNIRCTDDTLKTRTIFMHDWDEDGMLFTYSSLWVSQNASYAGACIKI